MFFVKGGGLLITTKRKLKFLYVSVISICSNDVKEGVKFFVILKAALSDAKSNLIYPCMTVRPQ